MKTKDNKILCIFRPASSDDENSQIECGARWGYKINSLQTTCKLKKLLFLNASIYVHNFILSLYLLTQMYVNFLSHLFQDSLLWNHWSDQRKTLVEWFRVTLIQIFIRNPGQPILPMWQKIFKKLINLLIIEQVAIYYYPSNL